MPYYELGDFLVEAVDSVLAQTYTNWELQIVDDCSPTTPASAVLSNLTDSRIKITRHEQNLGCANARNTAATKSNGEILLSFDSDDKLAPTYVERTLKAMLESQASAAYSDVKVFGMHDYIYKPTTELGAIFTGHYPHNTILFKRESFEAVGGYKSVGKVDDTEFWISLIELGTKFAYVSEPLYFYRRHSKSLTQSSDATLYLDLLNVMIQHHKSVELYIPQIIQSWIDIEDYKIQTCAEAKKLRSEFDHLQKEFDLLQQRCQSLSQRVSANEKVLDSVPGITRQISYLALKKIGIR